MSNDSMNHKHVTDQLLDSGAAGRDLVRCETDEEVMLKVMEAGYLDFPSAVVPTHKECRAYWDTTDHTLALMSEISGSTLQVGQENWVRIVNKTGVQINDGQVVYVSGAQGNRPTASLAIATTTDGADKTLGVATANIGNNDEGYVTTFGIVRGINTSGFTAGDCLYLSGTSAGGITNVMPDPPTYRQVRVGIALNSTNNGSILVCPHVMVDFDSVQPSHGFVNRTDSTLSFDNTSRIFTIAPTSSSYIYWRSGVKKTITTSKTVTLTDTAGVWFIYFDTSDVLTASQTAWDIDSENVPVAIVYWNKTAGRIQEERHGYRRNRAWHKWAHDTIGTRYESGLVGTFTNTTLAFTEGYVHDEDIDFYIGAQTNCVLWYLSATLGAMTFSEDTKPYGTTGGALAYDNAGTLAAVSSGRYVVNDVYASLSLSRPIYIRVGTDQYTTLAAARAASQATWSNIVSAELKLLYRVIYKNNGGTITFVESTDYRSGGSVPQGGTPAISPHGSTHVSSDLIPGMAVTNADNAFSVAQTIAGSAPASILAGEDKLGGGRLWLGYDGAGPTVILSDTSTNGRRWEFYHSGYTANGLALYNRTDNNFPIEWLSDGQTVCRGSAPSSVASGEVKIGGGEVWSYGKIKTTSTSDGAITTAGKITAKVAVPASFADLAAVRTYLASILT